MKKLSLAIILLGIGLVGASTAAPAPVHAATWHKGTPKSLRGVWETKKMKVFGNATFTLRITKKSALEQALDPDYQKNVKYQYLGRHIYKIRGFEPIYSKRYSTRYFKWFSKHHIMKSYGPINKTQKPVRIHYYR